MAVATSLLFFTCVVAAIVVRPFCLLAPFVPPNVSVRILLPFLSFQLFFPCAYRLFSVNEWPCCLRHHFCHLQCLVKIVAHSLLGRVSPRLPPLSFIL